MMPLPIDAVLGDLKAALGSGAAAVLQAPPGSGKTTRVPLALLDEPWLAGRRIVMLEPRRLAARAAAAYMAGLLGEPVGRTVGYRVRMDTRVGPQTRIEVVTEGVLTRLMQRDASLAGTGLVIFDEFHERHLEADLGLALCLDLQGVLNPDLKILVMSATMETGPVAALLGGAPVVACEGRLFEVQTRYAGRGGGQPLERAVAAAVLEAAAAEAGSILAFLPGAPEIRRVLALLQASRLGPEWMLAPLFGNLTREEQDRAIAPAPAGRRKIVLATNIAETSLTIEGIRVVVDSGFARVPRFDVRSGMTRLVTLPVARESADQRRGRAGRTEPGVCIRLWSEGAHGSLTPRNTPEILQADLAAPALELAAWGVDSPGRLRWLDPPPAAAFDQARQLLSEVGALDGAGAVTRHGRRMAELPMHPRLAHMVLAAMDAGAGAAACDLAALLSERDFVTFALRRTGLGPAAAAGDRARPAGGQTARGVAQSRGPGGLPPRHPSGGGAPPAPGRGGARRRADRSRPTARLGLPRPHWTAAHRRTRPLPFDQRPRRIFFRAGTAFRLGLHRGRRSRR